MNLPAWIIQQLRNVNKAAEKIEDALELLKSCGSSQEVHDAIGNLRSAQMRLLLDSRNNRDKYLKGEDFDADHE